jgi:hypothetical protein
VLYAPLSSVRVTQTMPAREQVVTLSENRCSEFNLMWRES